MTRALEVAGETRGWSSVSIPWTSTPLWDGESFDLGMAIEMFRNV